jgi:simple sugar transport system ATP-binding protein
MTEVRTRVVGVERRFGPVRALAGADLELRAGEVHGVLGANGAGKSTLFNVLGGLIRPDSGRIEVDGIEVELRSPRDAWKHGIALVHQHFTLVPALSVIENLALGVRDRTTRAIRVEVETIMERTGLRVPLAPAVESLGVGDRQRIEILKALLRHPEVLILDEPTAVLTPAEVHGLFALMRDLAADGRAVAIVAHKLDEVLAVADRVTVLRAGRTILTSPSSECTVDMLVHAMVGGGDIDPIEVGAIERALETNTPRDQASLDRSSTEVPGRRVAWLQGVTLQGEAGPGLRGIDFEVRPGEIVGIAGVEGNGQRDLAGVLAGRSRPDAGEFHVPAEVGFVPQDRTKEGLVADFDLVENVALTLHRTPEGAPGGWMRWADMRRAAEAIRIRYDVAAPTVRVKARTLSGGNQQRVIVGRELSVANELLVVENPTRGLDIASAAFVHAELRRLAQEGVAIVLLSTDLDEVLAMSTRVLAMAGGGLTAVPSGACTREGVGAFMLGANRHGGVDHDE